MKLDKNKNIFIVCIGDELLRGEIKETNSNWIARKLTNLGISPLKIFIIKDDARQINKEIREGINFVTGGLGPTHDDISREGIAQALKLPLVQNNEALKLIKDKSNVPEHKRMAEIPENATALENRAGVAPGFIVKSNKKKVIALPGPPDEMKSIFKEAMQKLKIQAQPAYSKQIKAPYPESRLIDIIDKIVDEFPTIEIGSYPGKKRARIRFEGDRKQVKKAVKKFKEKLEKKF